MDKKEKIKVVDELHSKFEKINTAILTNCQGLDVQQLTDLRTRCRRNLIDFRVVKNSLARRACQGTVHESLADYFTEATAIAFSSGDAAVLAKVLTDFAKKMPTLDIKGGILEGRKVEASEIKILADLPSREQLLSKLLSGFQSPLSGLVNVLQGTIRNFVYTLNAIASNKKEEK